MGSQSDAEVPSSARAPSCSVLIPTQDLPLQSQQDSDSDAIPKNQRLGRFTILRQLGSGGMGAVFAAYDEQLDRKVALKILHDHQGSLPTLRERALREAKALARVSHPRVVAMYDVLEANDQIYLAMEFVDGITLRRWQSEHKRSWREILAIYLAAGEGLLAAHQAGVIHRDFKPDNVIVGKDGLPRVADFGVARLGRTQPQSGLIDGCSFSEEAQATIAGIHSGTPGYMSPEQYGDQPVGAASDQFSFCVSLYEALCGYLPFAGTTAEELAQSVCGPLRTPPAKHDFPEELIRTIGRGLSPQPAQRFPSMNELLGELRAELGDTPFAAAKSRQRLVLVFALIVVFSLFTLQYLSKNQVRIIGSAVKLSIALIAVTLAAGFVNRKALISNRFHRNIYTQLLITFVQNFMSRLALMYLPEVPSRAIFVYEMVIWFGTVVTMARNSMPSLYALSALPALAVVVLACGRDVPRAYFLLLYPIILALILIAWHRRSQRAL